MYKYIMYKYVFVVGLCLLIFPMPFEPKECPRGTVCFLICVVHLSLGFKSNTCQIQVLLNEE